MIETTILIISVSWIVAGFSGLYFRERDWLKLTLKYPSAILVGSVIFVGTVMGPFTWILKWLTPEIKEKRQ
jgi:hypothetical protein